MARLGKLGTGGDWPLCRKTESRIDCSAVFGWLDGGLQCRLHCSKLKMGCKGCLRPLLVPTCGTATAHMGCLPGWCCGGSWGQCALALCSVLEGDRWVIDLTLRGACAAEGAGRGLACLQLQGCVACSRHRWLPYVCVLQGAMWLARDGCGPLPASPTACMIVCIASNAGSSRARQHAFETGDGLHF